MAQNQSFSPVFTIAPRTAGALMQIEAAKHAVDGLPITPRLLARLRETARLFSTHYSTMIEGNLLGQEQVVKVIAGNEHFEGRERDEREVKGYYAAFGDIDRLVEAGRAITEQAIQRLHALVMGGGRQKVTPTPYRDGQNVIRDGRTNAIVYMPPAAESVPSLMAELVDWINAKDDLPVPLRAGIAHYQFATIHPYYDGNGRSARLLTTLILHLGGYGLRGIYSLDEYYAQDLKAYYQALTVGPSHNYHLGRAEADITEWISYFVQGMAASFTKVEAQARREAHAGGTDASLLLRRLDARQRKVLTLFQKSREVTTNEIAALLGFQRQNAALLCRRWIQEGFLTVVDAAKKSRRYRLSDEAESALIPRK